MKKTYHHVAATSCYSPSLTEPFLALFDPKFLLLDLIDVCGTWSHVEMLHELVDRALIALSLSLHAAIAFVLDEPGQVEALGFILGE